MTITAGVIGLGIVSNRIMAQMKDHPEVEVVSVCDINAARVQEYIQDNGSVAGFTDYRQLIEQSSAELIYVATPPSLHADVVSCALSAGKHVLCEKPLANSLEEAEQMLELAEQSGKVHALHFPLQYSDAMYEFEQLYHSGYLGDLRRVEVIMQFPQWPRPWQQNAWVGGRRQGGYTLEVGVHFIQSVQRVFGKITDITGTLTYPADDTACEIAVLASGNLVDVESGKVQVLFNGFSQAGGKERVELNAYGTNGAISLQGWSNLFTCRLGEEWVAVKPAHHSNSLMANVIHAIHGESAVLADFQVGYDAQVVLEALRNLAK